MNNYRGRFAPSPTGPLHFGSLITAIGSYLQAKTQHGKWLLRIEDLDIPRTVKGASEQIIRTLEQLGFEWDEEIVYQSQRSHIYEEAHDFLLENKLSYPCSCSRKQLSQNNNNSVYPGNCRFQLSRPNTPASYRVKTDNRLIAIRDMLQIPLQQTLEDEVGDFIIKRNDGLFAYQLAVVVDDFQQNITDVVRGSDLYGVTPRQIYLQQLLNYPTPNYLHLPVATNQSREKLSKQTHAPAIDLSATNQPLVAALSFLGQTPPSELTQMDISSFWEWAICHWNPQKVPKKLKIPSNLSQIG